MKQIIALFTVIVILGFSNSNNNNNAYKTTQNSLDTTYIFSGDSSLKVIIKNGIQVLEEKVYLLDNEIYLDTLTLQKTKYIPETPGAIGGSWILYYENGKIKEKGQTKNEFGCWMNSGLFEYFNTHGDLVKTVYYDNWVKEGEGCHSTVHDITHKEFYTNGKIKVVKHFQSGLEEGELNPVGEWKYYNEKGEIARVEHYEYIYFRMEKK